MTTNRALLDLDRLPSLFPHAIARTTDLVGLGIPTASIRDRCGPEGPWQRLRPGVVLLSKAPPDRVQRLQAALRVAGQDAVITGREALWLHGVPLHPLGAVHLLTPPVCPHRMDGSVRVEPTDRMPEALWRRGFPTAPVARATVDACRHATADGDVRVIVGEAIHRGGITLDALHQELAHTRRRGTALLRSVLTDISEGARRNGTRLAAELITRAGLPQPAWGIRLTTRDDIHLGIVDAWWDDVGLAWDTDLFRPLSPRSALSLSTRQARFAAAGMVAVHTPRTHLRDNIAVTVDTLRAAYRRAAACPRPDVVAR